MALQTGRMRGCTSVRRSREETIGLFDTDRCSQQETKDASESESVQGCWTSEASERQFLRQWNVNLNHFFETSWNGDDSGSWSEGKVCVTQFDSLLQQTRSQLHEKSEGRNREQLRGAGWFSGDTEKASPVYKREKGRHGWQTWTFHQLGKGGRPLVDLPWT
jgi:hypothetical protein